MCRSRTPRSVLFVCRAPWPQGQAARRGETARRGGRGSTRTPRARVRRPGRRGGARARRHRAAAGRAAPWRRPRGARDPAGFPHIPGEGARGGGGGGSGGRANHYRPIFNLVLYRACRRPIQPRGPPQPVLDPAHAFAHARLGDQAGADVGDLASVHATTNGDIAVD